MSIEILSWAAREEYESWLADFPRRYRMNSSTLYSMYLMGEFEDDDDVWEWAQYWGHEQLGALRHTAPMAARPGATPGLIPSKADAYSMTPGVESSRQDRQYSLAA